MPRKERRPFVTARARALRRKQPRSVALEGFHKPHKSPRPTSVEQDRDGPWWGMGVVMTREAARASLAMRRLLWASFIRRVRLETHVRLAPAFSPTGLVAATTCLAATPSSANGASHGGPDPAGSPCQMDQVRQLSSTSRAGPLEEEVPLILYLGSVACARHCKGFQDRQWAEGYRLFSHEMYVLWKAARGQPKSWYVPHCCAKAGTWLGPVTGLAGSGWGSQPATTGRKNPLQHHFSENK